MGLEKIEEYKRTLGMTSAELAKKSGVPKGTLDKILSGVTKDPKLETLKAIARVLGLSLDDFDDTENTYKTQNVYTDEETFTQSQPDKIFSYYHSLNSTGKQIATEQVRLLTLDKKYTQSDIIISTIDSPEPDYLELNAAHERTDIEITKEDIEHDDALMNDDSIWQ